MKVNRTRALGMELIIKRSWLAPQAVEAFVKDQEVYRNLCTVII